MRIVVYARVSTGEQDPEGQLVELRKFCQQKGWEIVKEFVDQGISGSVPPSDRPAFQQMISFCKQNGVTTIVMYDMTRFYRPQSPEMVFDELNKLVREGIFVVFIKEPEIQDPMLKKLWEFIKAWFSSYERYQISMRTRYGLQKLKKQGKLYHRPSLLHYFSAWIFGKNLAELTSEDLERGKQLLCAILRKYWGKVKKTKLPDLLRTTELSEMYVRFPQAPKDYRAFVNFFKKCCINNVD